MHSDPYQIINTVIISEKSNALTEELNKYVFKVHPSANKIQISRAIQEIFSVKPLAVNVSNYRGKKKRYKMKTLGKRSDWKKAIITLSSDDKIEIF